MKSQRILGLFLIVCSSSMCGCQLALKKLIPAAEQRASAATSTTSASTVRDKEYLNYQFQVRTHFLQKDYAWIDEEADKARANKLRLPGGYWKLRVLYGTFEEPPTGGSADADWKDLIAQLTSWTRQRPASVTAKVALAGAWKDYAWKARGNGFADKN